MSNYYWKISYDHLENKEILIEGPRNCDCSIPTPFKFRLYDDDGELNLSGECSDNNSENAFGPLDDYGMPSYGCTEIRYLNEETGLWEPL